MSLESFSSYYYPAKCKKCGDVTKALRSPLMSSPRVGKCGLRVKNGRCNGEVFFYQEPRLPKTPKPMPIIVNDGGMADLIDRKERPYDLDREMDTLQSALGEQESWGGEESST